ncbi:MAG: hypothetical protein R3263_10340, partial [Myxococcota bacterium]|nr:hypothetical protein [Myxococcota bacterium]
MGASLRAGVAAAPLEAPPGVALMGYGARQGVSEGGGDPLSARALALESAEGAALLVLCDLCLLAPAQADGIRDALAARTGLPRARILVGCIHTHSAPDTGLGDLLAGRPEPAHVAPLREAAVRAGSEAWEGRRPARLGVGHARARVGRNRRREGGPLDEDVLVVRVDALE